MTDKYLEEEALVALSSYFKADPEEAEAVRPAAEKGLRLLHALRRRRRMEVERDIRCDGAL